MSEVSLEDERYPIRPGPHGNLHSKQDPGSARGRENSGGRKLSPIVLILAGVNLGSERARESGSQGARERESQGARERESQGVRERESQGVRESGSERARESGSQGAGESGSERVRERLGSSWRYLGMDV